MHHVWHRWLILRSTPASLGLDAPPFSFPSRMLPPALSDLRPGGAMWRNAHTAVNLNAAGLSIEAVQAMLRERIAEGAAACERSPTCDAPPRLQCSLHPDRWETLPNGALQERYHAPHCDRASWTWEAGERFVVVSFFRPQKPLAAPKKVWAHTVLYAMYVGADEDDEIPHAAVQLGGVMSLYWLLLQAFNAGAFEVDHLRVLLGVGSEPPGMQLTSSRVVFAVLQVLLAWWVVSRLWCRRGRRTRLLSAHEEKTLLL